MGTIAGLFCWADDPSRKSDGSVIVGILYYQHRVSSNKVYVILICRYIPIVMYLLPRVSITCYGLRDHPLLLVLYSAIDYEDKN